MTFKVEGPGHYGWDRFKFCLPVAATALISKLLEYKQREKSLLWYSLLQHQSVKIVTHTIL